MENRLAERIRTGIGEAMASRGLSQRQLARLLTRATKVAWGQMDVPRLLKGQVKLRVEDVEAIANVLGLSIVDLVREPGRELVRDLTPEEMQIFTALRANPRWVKVVLDIVRISELPMTPVKTGRRRPRPVAARAKILELPPAPDPA